MSAPYNADIIAHEKMSAFAYISILDVSLKLLIVYLLVVLPFDKLIVMAVLTLLVQLQSLKSVQVKLKSVLKLVKHFLLS